MKPSFVLKRPVNFCSDTKCNKKFGFLSQKFHCRACGDVFCKACIKQKTYLRYANKDVRVCNDCYYRLKNIDEYRTRHIISKLDYLENQKYEKERGNSAPRCCRCTDRFGIIKRRKFCGECQKACCSRCRSYAFSQPTGKPLRVCYNCHECGLVTPHNIKVDSNNEQSDWTLNQSQGDTTIEEYCNRTSR
uniref:protein FREE1-like n=1 Tax=Styela clava TaxID=7725 RepID=UPI001939812B|nr:protein FREE1-like [Styela clava]XP_039262190.1 protein FREE1-like [Styela clava]